jgi:hypothetical protein
MLPCAPDVRKLVPRFAAETRFPGYSLPKPVGVITGELPEVDRRFANYFFYV